MNDINIKEKMCCNCRFWDNQGQDNGYCICDLKNDNNINHLTHFSYSCRNYITKEK